MVIVLAAVGFMAATSAGQARSTSAGIAAAVVSVPCSVASLAAAITAANGAGSPSTLQLAPDCVYDIVTPATAADGLPVITGDVRRVGGSTAGPNVDVGQGTSTIQRDSTAAAFRLLDVAVGGKLRLQNVVLVNGSTAGLGGAIQNAGTLTVVSSFFSANAAGNGGGIANLAGATATVTRSTFSSNTTSGVGGGAILRRS